MDRGKHGHAPCIPGAKKTSLREKTEPLVLRAQSGDVASFSKLYELYYQKVYALARSTVKTDADAEDVLQLTFIKAWDNLAKLKDAAAFSTWIQRITLNQCYSLLRSQHVAISIDRDDEDSEPIQLESDLELPEAYAERSDLRARLHKIINELSPVQKQTILLYYFDGLPVENIARVMGCSENTVKSRLFLARKAIRTEIEEEEKKSGQPFFGIIGFATVPFGKLLVADVRANMVPRATAAVLHHSVMQHAAQAVSRSAEAAVSNTARRAAAPAAGSAAKTAAVVGAKAAGKAAAGKIIAGVLAGMLVAGAAAGGTVAAIHMMRSDDTESSVISESLFPSAETAETFLPSGTADASEADRVEEPSAEATSDAVPEYAEAYRAYSEYLLENQPGIDNYVWQKGYLQDYDPVTGDPLPLNDETMSRPVVFADVYGDALPELIYLGDAEEGEFQGGYYYGTSVTLHVVTYADGQIVQLYQQPFGGWGDSAGSYYLFLKEGVKGLYYNYRIGDLWDENKYVLLSEHADGSFGKTAVCRRYEDEPEYDPVYTEHVSYYGNNDAAVSESEYEEIRSDLESGTAQILMYCNYANAFARNYVNAHGCPAMTCTEALEWLAAQIGTNP
ncbi:MAG: RNA polymerase sigma factor [Clostridia bacterium]|nr:RNA polymerase sigma factor [Clostridia bacterium]